MFVIWIIFILNFNSIICTQIQSPQKYSQILERVNELLQQVDKQIDKERELLSKFTDANYKSSLLLSMSAATTAKSSVTVRLYHKNNGRSIQMFPQIPSKETPKGNNLKIIDIVSDWILKKGRRKLEQQNGTGFK